MTASSPDPAHSQAVTEKPPLRRMHNFRNLWLSRVLSVFGSSVTLVALPVLVYQETRSPFLVSLVAAGETLPYVFFGLLAGAVADRVHRRRLMVAADLLNCVCLGSVPLAAALGVLTIGHTLAAAFLSSTLYIFFDAAGYGLIPAAVGRDRLSEANSALWGGETAVRIAGTALAGALIAVTSASGALALDALSFLASALLIRAIVYTPARRGDGAGERPGLVASIGEGLRFLWGHRVLRTMTFAGSLQSFAGGAFLGQLVVFADRALGIGASDARIGLLFTSWSAGGILGSLLLPRLRRRTSALRIMLVALPASTLLGLSAVLATDWRVALVAIAAWGSTYLMVIVNTMTYAQEVTPEELQGRVNTTRRMLSSGLGVPLGAMVASAVTVAFDVRAGMLLAVAAIALAAVLVWATSGSALRKGEIPSDSAFPPAAASSGAAGKSTIEVWHHLSCPASRRIRESLEKAGLDYRSREYLENAPDAAEIDALLRRLRAEPWDVVRMHEPVADRLGLGTWPHDRQRWIDALAEHPSLLQRPIVIRGDGKAAVVASPEILEEFLSEKE